MSARRKYSGTLTAAACSQGVSELCGNSQMLPIAIESRLRTAALGLGETPDLPMSYTVRASCPSKLKSQSSRVARRPHDSVMGSSLGTTPLKSGGP